MPHGWGGDCASQKRAACRVGVVGARLGCEGAGGRPGRAGPAGLSLRRPASPSPVLAQNYIGGGLRSSTCRGFKMPTAPVIETRRGLLPSGALGSAGMGMSPSVSPPHNGPRGPLPAADPTPCNLTGLWVLSCLRPSEHPASVAPGPAPPGVCWTRLTKELRPHRPICPGKASPRSGPWGAQLNSLPRPSPPLAAAPHSAVRGDGDESSRSAWGRCTCRPSTDRTLSSLRFCLWNLRTDNCLSDCAHQTPGFYG